MKNIRGPTRAWSRFRSWCDSVGLVNDYFLDNFTRGQQIKLVGAFAMDMRGARFSGPAYDNLAEGTIRSAVSYVASTFQENDRPNPTIEDYGELGILLSRQFRAFRNDDPNPIQQKCVPPCIIRDSQKINCLNPNELSVS